VDKLGDKGDKSQRQVAQTTNTQTEKARIGALGEDLACAYLAKQGYEIMERNYWRKWGEIDIVARQGDNWRFVEVKTVTRRYISTSDYEPEDNMHAWKKKRLRRVIETYLLAKEEVMGEAAEWQVDLITVYITPEGRELKVEWLEDIVL
jgi:putative endonuclease